MPDWYLGDFHQRLDVILDKAFEPLMGHVNKIRDKFRMVFDIEMQKETVARIVECEDFVTCLEKLDEFNRSVDDVHEMVNFFFFLLLISWKIFYTRFIFLFMFYPDGKRVLS